MKPVVHNKQTGPDKELTPLITLESPSRLIPILVQPKRIIQLKHSNRTEIPDKLALSGHELVVVVVVILEQNQ